MNIRYHFFLRGDDGELISRRDGTLDGSPWPVGEWRETSGEGPHSGPGWLHCYDTPELAEFHDPLHYVYGPNAELWRVECDGTELRDGAMKCGWTRMRPIERIERAVPTDEQHVRYGILCAMAVLPDEPWSADWRHWAEGWLSGRDRSAASAQFAERAAAAYSARSEAATAASWGAAAATARWARAERAACAARAVAEIGTIDLASIARRVMEG